MNTLITAIVALTLQASLCLFVSQPAYAAATATNNEEDIQKIRKIAFFPLENLSGNFEAQRAITPIIEKKLKNKGFDVIPYEQVDKFLIKKRIRYTGSIDKITAMQARQILHCDAVLVGSIDQYVKTGNDIYVGLTLRLVDSWGNLIIWMETLSYAGKDFTGLLGLGRVKSINKLSSKLVSNIIKSMPHEYRIINRNENFFEIGNVQIEPATAKGGETVKLTARIVSSDPEKPPTLVRVRVNERLNDLKSSDGEYFTGNISAPFEDGSYAVDITAFGHNKEAFYFYSVGEISVDMKPPVVKISTNKYAMRGWTKKDYILFTVNSNEPVKKWQVRIVDENGTYSRGGKWYTTLPRKLIWRGETDGGGKNKDGKYTLRLFAWDAAGNKGVSEVNIRLDATPPVVKVNLAKNSGMKGKLLFNMNYDEKEVIDEWKFMVFDEKANLIKELSGKGNIDKKITVPWLMDREDENLSDNRERKIAYTFKAVDAAGNTFETSGQEFFFISGKEEKFTKRMENMKTGWGMSDF